MIDKINTYISTCLELYDNSELVNGSTKYKGKKKSNSQKQSVTPKFMEMVSWCFVFTMREDKQIILFVIQIETHPMCS